MIEKVTSITFRVDSKDILAFKKYQFLLNTNQKEYFSIQKTLFNLVQNAKNYFETSGIQFPLEYPANFVEKLTSIGNKNLMLSKPKVLLVPLSEQEKQCFYQVAYAVQTHDKIEDISYPYIFNRLLQLNEMSNNERS